MAFKNTFEYITILKVTIDINIECSDEDFAKKLDRFCLRVDQYAIVLKLDPRLVSKVKEDNLNFSRILKGIVSFRNYTDQITMLKGRYRFNFPNQKKIQLPAVPEMTELSKELESNIQERFEQLINDCIRSSNYNQEIGRSLGITAEASSFNPNEGKPEFHISLSSAGHPVLVWQKKNFDAVEIWKKTDDGWFRLGRDYSPDYIDKSPLPDKGKFQTWKYKMIYVFDDEMMGEWSEEKMIDITG